MRKQRRKKTRNIRNKAQLEANKKHIKNLSNKQLTESQINLLAKGLKFIPTPVTNDNRIRQQLLHDFEQFARRMRLQYMYYGTEKEQHPFYVKSNWNPPIQQSVALESYLEEVKISLAEINLTKPKNNLALAECEALKTLKGDEQINLKKADKGTNTVVMSKQDKLNKGQIQLNVREYYRPLESPMVEETGKRVLDLINELYHGKNIDEMTKKWLCQTPTPPRIPVFYTLTKIHKPTPVGRPIISGCDGPTEKLSCFVDKIRQPIAQQQKSYLKDTTVFINFIEKTKLPKGVILVSMDVTSLYKNIPQEEGINIVCTAYETFYHETPPIPKRLLGKALTLILQENSFQFNKRNYLQTHGTAMGTKMAVAFANIFMGEIEKQILNESAHKPLAWKRYIDDIISLWHSSRDVVEKFIEKANKHHPTIKFTAEISRTDATFLDTTIHKGQRFYKESVLDTRTHFKPTETFQHTFFTSCHPPGVKKGFVKREALRLLRTNSSMKTFEESIIKFKKHLMERGYPQNFINNALSEVRFEQRTQALLQRNKTKKTNLALHNTIPPGSSKSQRNLNKEVVPNTATTIAKPNFQGAAHNIIQKRTLP